MNKMSNKLLKLWLPVVAWMGLIFWLSSIPQLRSTLPSCWDLILRKIAHMAEFGILFFLWARALGMKRKSSLYWAALISIVYALSDEYHQTFVFGREGCLKDVGFDSLGVIVGYFWLYYRRSKS